MAKTKKKITLLQKRLLFFLLLLGTICLSSTMVRSGLVGDLGMGFWGANGHDGVWHLAVINQVLKNFPPLNPVFAHTNLTNYHLGYDFLIALLVKITPFSKITLYFQIVPVVTAFLIGWLSFQVGRLWKKDFWVGFWLAFLNFFAGSFGWIVTLLRSGDLGGESLFWSMQSASVLINPPFAFSLVFLLLGIKFILEKKKVNLKSILLLGLVFGLIINIKAYGGLVGLVALGGYSFIKFLKKEKKVFLIFLVALLISFGLFLPLNSGASSLFEFSPLWFIHTMIESPDRFYWLKLALARYSLLAEGLGLKLILVEIIGISIFMIGNLGARVLGLFSLGKDLFKKKILDFDFFLLFGMLAGFLPSFFFIQKGTSWNTIQFFYYFLFFSNFYFAKFLGDLSGNKKLKNKVILVLLVLLTLPTSFSTLKDYFGYPPPAAIPGLELEALSFLKEQKDGLVLTFPYDKYLKEGLETPLPLYKYETTAYVSAFSEKVTYLEDEMNLEITNYSWRERRGQVESFFKSEDNNFARGFLLNNQINYLYLLEGQDFLLPESDLGLKMIFSNKLVRIYEVLR